MVRCTLRWLAAVLRITVDDTEKCWSVSYDLVNKNKNVIVYHIIRGTELTTIPWVQSPTLRFVRGTLSLGLYSWYVRTVCQSKYVVMDRVHLDLCLTMGENSAHRVSSHSIRTTTDMGWGHDIHTTIFHKGNKRRASRQRERLWSRGIIHRVLLRIHLLSICRRTKKSTRNCTCRRWFRAIGCRIWGREWIYPACINNEPVGGGAMAAGNGTVAASDRIEESAVVVFGYDCWTRRIFIVILKMQRSEAIVYIYLHESIVFRHLRFIPRRWWFICSSRGNKLLSCLKAADICAVQRMDGIVWC